MNLKTENWNGHQIRFVEREAGEWWAVAADVVRALGLSQVTRALSGLKDGVTISKVIDSLGRQQEVNIINEKAIYRLVFKSRKREAEAFQDWIFDVIQQLRKQTGLEGFQIFRMLDKEHQKAAMERLRQSLRDPARVDFIKANTIANKAVSTRHGYPKMLKKHEMTPAMLVDRESILDDTVELMSVADRFGLPIKVSDTIYEKYTKQNDVG